MPQIPLTVRRWKRVEYERLVDLGAFDGDPVELLGGQLIVAEPKGSLHATAAPYGWRYRSVQTLTPPALIAPLGLPASPIAVAALLP